MLTRTTDLFTPFHENPALVGLNLLTGIRSLGNPFLILDKRKKIKGYNKVGDAS